MPWTICTPIPNHDDKVWCVRIPMPSEIPQPIPKGPRGGVEGVPGDPSPWKWAHSDSIKPQVFDNLSTLAAIDELASRLEPGLRDSVQKLVRSAARRPGDIPQGMSVHFD